MPGAPSDMLEISHLRYIVTVQRERSISKAAEKLFVSQPYVSRVIKEIENTLGIVIFTRGKQGMITTAAGEEFIYYAEAVLAQYDQLCQNFAPGSDANRYLRVSVNRSSHIAEAFIEYLYKRYKTGAQSQKRHIDFRECSRENVLQDVADKKVDVGVVMYTTAEQRALEAIAERRGLEVTPCCRLKRYVIVSKNHPLASRGTPVKLSELYKYGTVRYGDRVEEGLGQEQRSMEENMVDINALPMVVNVYDRATQTNLLAYTDCFIFGLCSFEAQESMFNMATLLIDYEGNRKLEAQRTVVYIITAKGRRLSQEARDFISCTKEYFSRIDNT